MLFLVTEESVKLGE